VTHGDRVDFCQKIMPIKELARYGRPLEFPQDPSIPPLAWQHRGNEICYGTEIFNSRNR